MRKWLWLIAPLLVVALASLAIACDDEEEGAPAGETPAAEVSVEIVAPEEGATASSPVTLEVSASGITIAKAGDAVEGAAHFHAFVDLDPVEEGEVVPQDTEGIFHFATNTLELELEAGEHTVTVVLGDNDHVRLPDVAPATVTFTVE